MKRIFLSLPMSGRSDEEIMAQIEEMKAMFLLKNPLDKGEEIEFVHNLENDINPIRYIDVKTEPLLYLGEAIRKLAYCDAVYFAKGWKSVRGCIIEWQTCAKYGIPRYIMLRDGSIAKVVNPKEENRDE